MSEPQELRQRELWRWQSQGEGGGGRFASIRPRASILAPPSCQETQKRAGSINSTASQQARIPQRWGSAEPDCAALLRARCLLPTLPFSPLAQYVASCLLSTLCLTCSLSVTNSALKLNNSTTQLLPAQRRQLRHFQGHSPQAAAPQPQPSECSQPCQWSKCQVC